ncbi:DUF4129 domain-containing protein [Marinobacterium marinum]|uniref:DUF4129 domain-containing protein n=1 Tax=Marinobacterium marinum TaxID=2756129 RepID=A0A7W1X028_9GAMM|nr:DUF4129 domain-containing protein [Marinobacterium marinum]MBA4503356.1 DUF4129 domain-containing protein [Marinobacterium marinum]
MNLTDLQIRAQVRTPWQALDLGVLMGRRWFKALWLAWLVPAVMLFLPLSVIFFDSPWIVAMVLWWLKPLLERLPLLLLSRFLFGENSLRGVDWRQLRSLWLFDCLSALLWRRFDLQRSFRQAVTVLEKQKGRARATRCQTLSYNGGSEAVWLTLVLVHLEMLLVVAGPVLAIMLVGDFVEPDWFWLFDAEGGWPEHVSNAFTLLCMSVVAPFYVSSGFALYINRRVELEAWDLELLFRQIASERKSAGEAAAGATSSVMMLAGTLLLSLALTFMPAAPVMAANPLLDSTPEQSKEEVLVLLEEPPFVIEKEHTRWSLKEFDGVDKEESESDWGSWLDDWDFEPSDGSGVYRVAEVLVWVGILALLVLLARALMRHLNGLEVSEPLEPARTMPQVVMGMSIAADSLPEDITAAVTEALERGDTRVALSLVYRYALHRLVHHHGVAVESWYTELECAQAVRAYETLALEGLFDELTQTWLSQAYAHEAPARGKVEQLLTGLRKVLS